MGRRSINTTKSGKYMNPTDQARKEARKKELKKNKKQRQMVRAAVLKNKDPSQILEEMEKIDEMEYNVLQPSPLNEKVLRDKRKKLKETFDRVMRLYHNDEPEHWAELKRKEVEYEKKRMKKQQYYESVKHAQSVQIDEIPLPAPVTAPATPGPTPSVAPAGTGFGVGVGMRVPPPPIALALPPYAPGAPPGVPKNSEAIPAEVQPEKPSEDEDMDWLGVPPGPPPDLFAMSELDSDAEGNSDYDGEMDEVDDEDKEEASEPSTQNIDDFMKEMEHVHKRKHRKLAREDDEGGSDDEDDEEPNEMSVRSQDSDSDNKSNLTSDSEDEPDDDDDDEDEDMDEPPAKTEPAKPTVPAITTPAPPKAPTLPPLPLPPSSSVPGPPQVPQLPPIHNIGPPAIMYRPPPMRPPNPHSGPGSGFGMRMPPGPPPGSRPPHALGPMPRMGLRMPPGPPPGLPPRMAHHNKQGGPPAPPALKDSAKGVTTITAKPQIRNLSADVTRFVPSTLRVKRDDQRRTARPKQTAADIGHAPSESHTKPPTKDDAYMQFMNEMQGLL